jgi:hypothetical protein
MSSDTSGGYSPFDLREMDEQTAKQTLTVNEFERWESVNDRLDEADEVREQWADQEDRVEDLVVHADPEQLGTRVDVFGNDVLVHVNSDDPEVRDAAEALEAHDDADMDDLSEADRREIGDDLTTLLDAILVRWNGTEWEDLPDDVRTDVLADAREKWGFDNLMLAWADIAEAVYEDREQRVDVVEKFRDPERRGNR